jgi:hypothetical protein
LLPRKPYSKVLNARQHLRIRLEAKCIPPLEALRMDIECRSERFVAAGCLPRSTLTRSTPADKGMISTARGRDYCGKPFSQHVSFGVTISQNRIRTDPMLITVFRCEWEALSRLLSFYISSGRADRRRRRRSTEPSVRRFGMRLSRQRSSMRIETVCPIRPVPGVAMMQAAQPRHRQHFPIRAWPLLHHPPVRRVLR